MKRVLAAILLLFSSHAFAAGLNIPDDDYNPSSDLPADSWFAAFGAGDDITDVSKESFVSRDNPLAPDRFLVKDQDEGVPTVNLSLGYQFAHDSDWFPYCAFAIAYTHGFSATIKGDIEVTSLATANNFTYKYEISRDTGEFQGKFDLFRVKHVMLYILGGIGGSRNTAEKYSETPKTGVAPRVSPDFDSQSEFQIAYSYGGGFDIQAYDNVWFSLGYQYGNFGSVETSNGTGVFASDNLKTRFRAHSVMLSLMYFFNRGK